MFYTFDIRYQGSNKAMTNTIIHVVVQLYCAGSMEILLPVYIISQIHFLGIFLNNLFSQ